ncbi:MAG: LysR substrate-binding domain-containing protein [Pseudomonadota bacterium]
MGSSLPPPAWLKTFEAAARLGGFAAAGEELGLTPAAVSQQIRALEGRLGFQLFQRKARGVVLSEMGQSYLPAVQQAFDALSLATAGLFGIDEAEQLTIRSTASFTSHRLAPALPSFREAHPEIPIRILTPVWADLLEEDKVDIVIRYGDGKWPGQKVIRLSEPRSLPICPPDTKFSSDPVEAVASLMRREAIDVMGYESLWTLFARQYAIDEGQIRSGLSADNSIVAMEMVAAGLGIALIAEDLVERPIRNGRVVPAPGLFLDHGQAHYAVVPIQKTPRQEALVFADWMASTFGF